MTDDLRERVAEVMWMADPDPYDPADRRPFSEADWEARRNYLAEADAAITLIRNETLEEAARVIGVKLFNRSCTCGFEVATAIRALKEKA